jgi:hypothetical protein
VPAFLTMLIPILLALLMPKEVRAQDEAAHPSDRDKGYLHSPTLIDTRIYGAEPLSPRKPPAGEVYVPPVQVPQSAAFEGLAIVEEGRARIAADSRERATPLEAIRAAITQWIPVRAYTRAAMPVFPPDNEVEGPVAVLRALEFSANEEDAKYILQSHSTAEAMWKAKNLRERWLANQAMDDSPLAARFASLLDPTFSLIALALGLTLWKRFRTKENLGEHMTIIAGRRNSTFLVMWSVRLGVLAVAFSIHWALGVLMTFGLYIHLTTIRR